MDLTQLEMFNAVALTGSITQAAQKVHRVPSNLTTRIRQLEADLGVELFIRENQRLRLSPAGHNFLRYSRQILALVDEARMVVAGDEPQGLFALGALESTAAVRIPETLAQFNQRYPRIQFALSTGPSGTMIDGVLEGTLSAAFVDGPLSHPELEGMPVYREEMMLVTPAGHAEVARATQVSGNDVYAFRANCSYRRHLESWFHADRATPGVAARGDDPPAGSVYSAAKRTSSTSAFSINRLSGSSAYGANAGRKSYPHCSYRRTAARCLMPVSSLTVWQ